MEIKTPPSQVDSGGALEDSPAISLQKSLSGSSDRGSIPSQETGNTPRSSELIISNTFPSYENQVPANLTGLEPPSNAPPMGQNIFWSPPLSVPNKLSQTAPASSGSDGTFNSGPSENSQVASSANFNPGPTNNSPPQSTGDGGGDSLGSTLPQVFPRSGNANTSQNPGTSPIFAPPTFGSGTPTEGNTFPGTDTSPGTDSALGTGPAPGIDSAPPTGQRFGLAPENAPDLTGGTPADLTGGQNSLSGAKVLSGNGNSPPAPPTDREITVASAEGILNSQPEHAAMGGGGSLMVFSFAEEPVQTRLDKIQSGDRVYALDLPDGQERLQRELNLVWDWLKPEGEVTALRGGDINSIVSMKFTYVETQLEGSQDGRVIRMFSCGTQTSVVWNDIWYNIVGSSPGFDLSQFCPQPTYRDYRISGDKITVDIPLAGHDALFFVTFNPVEWIEPAFQESIGGKHIEGDPRPLSPEYLLATVQKSELIRVLYLQ